MSKKEMKINKPWGWERWISVNEKYVMKQLFMKKGNRCSLQYHEKKHETLYMQEGEMKMTIGTIDNPRKNEVILKPDEHYIIEPFTVHQCEAVTDILYLEASTPELEDVVRLEDDYGREGTSEP